MPMEIWQQPNIINWSQILVDSFQQLTGERLIEGQDTPEQLAEALFLAPFVIVSRHEQEPQPALV